MEKSNRASKVIRVKRKKPGPAPTGKGELIAIRWRDADLAIIDDYAKAHDLNRGEALREIVRESKKR